jgi:hypothetical protein
MMAFLRCALAMLRGWSVNQPQTKNKIDLKKYPNLNTRLRMQPANCSTIKKKYAAGKSKAGFSAGAGTFPRPVVLL